MKICAPLLVMGQRDPGDLRHARRLMQKGHQRRCARRWSATTNPAYVFELTQALALYHFYQERLGECDAEIERALLQKATLPGRDPTEPMPKPHHRIR
jgi:hypothetical protein